MKPDPISPAMHRMIDLQLERFAWLIRAGEQIRNENNREAGVSKKAPATQSEEAA